MCILRRDNIFKRYSLIGDNILTWYSLIGDSILKIVLVGTATQNVHL